MPFWFKTQQSIVQICYFNSQCLIPITSLNAIKDEKYTKYLWYKTLKVTSVLINGSEHAILCFLELLCTCTMHLGYTGLQQGKLNPEKIQTHFPESASPQHFPGYGNSQAKEPKTSSWLPKHHQKQLPPGFCDFIQGHRYHSPVFIGNSQHLIPSTSNHHHGWNTEFAQKEKDLVLPQFMKLKDNPQLFRILL